MPPKVSATAVPVKLPATPIPLHPEIRDAAIETIAAEQWLQSNGWREPLLRMSSPEAGEFLSGFSAFQARLSNLVGELERDARIWRRIAFIAAGVALVSVGIAPLIPLFL